MLYSLVRHVDRCIAKPRTDTVISTTPAEESGERNILIYIRNQRQIFWRSCI